MVVGSFNCKNLSWSTRATERMNSLQRINYASMYISILKNNYLREIIKYMKLLEN